MTQSPNPYGDGTPGPQPDPTAPPQYSMPGNTSPASPPPGTSYGPPPADGGYPPPAGGTYPPPGGFPPPTGPSPQGTYYGGGGVPAGYATNEEKTWALIAHFGGIIAGFIAPLVAMLAKGNESPTVRAHAIEALNFQITWGIATVIAAILATCTFGLLFFLPLVTWIILIVFSLIGGMRANEGVLYRYPMSIRMVK